MSETESTRLDHDEALLLLTNRVLFDFISLQIDRGAFSVEEAKRLIEFSAGEVKRGAPGLSEQVDFFSQVFVKRFEETDYQRPK